MKQKDIALIIAVAGFSTVVAFVIGNFVLAPPKNRQTEVKVVDAITSEFTPPDKRYFNSTSINPTQKIEIGNSSNPTPFQP